MPFLEFLAHFRPVCPPYTLLTHTYEEQYCLLGLTLKPLHAHILKDFYFLERKYPNKSILYVARKVHVPTTNISSFFVKL